MMLACALVLPAPLSALPREDTRLDADAYVARGFEYLARPRPEDQTEAARLFAKALRLGPDRSDAHLGLARVSLYLYTLGQDESPARLQAALEESRRAVDLAPHDAAAAATRALALAAADRLTPALEEANRAVSADAAGAQAHLALCIVRRLRKDEGGALESCRRAAEIAPRDPRVLSGLGEALRETGRYSQASEIFGQAIDLDHEALIPQLGAAATLVKSGNYPLARGLYDTLMKKWDYGTSRIRQGAGALFVMTRDFDAALPFYESLEVPQGTTLPGLLLLYGKAYCLSHLGRDAEAEYFLSALIERVPVDYDGPARGREILFHAYDDLISYFRSKGQDRKVTALLKSACARPLVPTRLARTYAGHLEARRDTGDAAATLEKTILGSDPLEDPLEIADSVLMLARLRTGNGVRRLPEKSQAARALDLASARLLSSDLGAAHYRLARALALVRRPEAAVQSLERARRSGFLPIDQMAAEPDFANIRQDPGFATLLDRHPQAPEKPPVP